MLTSTPAGSSSAVRPANCAGAPRAAHSVGTPIPRSLPSAPVPAATAIDAMLALSVRTSDPATMAPMELALEELMPAQRLMPMLRAPKHVSRLAR